MKYLFVSLALIFASLVHAQDSLYYDGFKSTINEVNLDDRHKIKVDVGFNYTEQAADSSNMPLKIRLLHEGEEVYSKVKNVSRRNGNTLGGKTSFYLIPYRNIDLDEGTYTLDLELSIGAYGEDALVQASQSIRMNQPKRYIVLLTVSGGEVKPLTNETWDAVPFFGKHAKSNPDPQWWVYIDKTWTQSSKVNKNSFFAPSASFEVILLHTEQLHLKLYDEDHFINRDDKIGSFRVYHPELEMEDKMLNFNDYKVEGVTITMQKRELIKN